MANNFIQLINSDKLTLVDFSAEWCGPCKMQAPILQQLKTMIGDKVTIIKIDVDRSPQTAAYYNIQGVPTLILFQKGEIKWRQSGVARAEQLKNIINNFSPN